MVKYYLIIIVMIVIALVFLQSQTMKRSFQAMVLQRLRQDAPDHHSFMTENDIKHLPEPVQKYLRYTGAIGQEKVWNYRIAFQGKMKMDPKQDWVKVKTEQINFVHHPARLFFIQAQKVGIPFVGLDSYLGGKGNMLIKVLSALTVVDSKGPEMDQSELVTLFNDMCLYAPGTLVDPAIRWEPINRLTVKGIFEDKGCSVSALLYFNELGELVNFVTDDRYCSPTGKTFQKVRWSTPVKEYREINGVKVATYGEGIWHFAEGDLCYAKFALKGIEYNIKNFQSAD